MGAHLIPGDIVYIEPQSMLIQYMEYSQNNYIYLLSSLGNDSYCCQVYSNHELKYTNAWGKSYLLEPILLKCIGKTQYQQGYSLVNCETFELIENDTPEYKNFFEIQNDLERIKEKPQDYKYLLN